MSAWAVLPLGMAAGLDLYLTLLVLGVSARMGWAEALGPSFGSLSATPVLALALVLYLVETTADRFPGLTLGWDALNLVVRPMAVGLVVALLAREAGPGPGAALGLTAAIVALVVHGIRTGWRLVLTLTEARRSVRALASAIEDACALAFVALLLDRPTLAGVVGLTLLALLLTQSRRYLTLFVFGMHLLRARVSSLFSSRRWRSIDPGTLKADGTGSTTRGQRAALLGPGGPGTLQTGWLLVGTGERPRFRSVASAPGSSVGDWSGAMVRTGFLYDTLLHDGGEGVRALFLPKDGPAPEAVRSALAAGR